MTTKRQKAAIHFCEEWLEIEFNGDINNFQEVSNFLGEYLDDAKSKARELSCEYSTYQWEKMMN